MVSGEIGVCASDSSPQDCLLWSSSWGGLVRVSTLVKIEITSQTRGFCERTYLRIRMDRECRDDRRSFDDDPVATLAESRCRFLRLRGCHRCFEASRPIAGLLSRGR